LNNKYDTNYFAKIIGEGKGNGSGVVEEFGKELE